MKQWFILSRDQIVGPLSSDELRLLAKSGGLFPDAQISTDRQRWYRAGSVKGLEFNPGPISTENSERVAERIDVTMQGAIGAPVPAATHAEANTALWLTAGAVGGGLALLLLCCGALGIVFSRPADTSRTTTAVPASAPSPTPEQIMGQATLDYWTAARSALQSGMREALQQQNVNLMAGHLSAVEYLPVTNVDPAAVRTVLEVCANMRNFIQLNVRAKDPGLYLEAIARGIRGDPFGTGLQLRQETLGAQQGLQSAAANAIQTRAALSQHYGAEFPALLE